MNISEFVGLQMLAFLRNSVFFSVCDKSSHISSGSIVKLLLEVVVVVVVNFGLVIPGLIWSNLIWSCALLNLCNLIRLQCFMAPVKQLQYIKYIPSLTSPYMRARVRVCTCVHACACVHACVRACMHVHVCVRMRACVRACACVRAHACVRGHACACMRACMRACVHVCV